MLVAREHRLRGVVHVDDLVLRVREHHAGGDLVERLADAGVLGREARSVSICVRSLPCMSSSACSTWPASSVPPRSICVVVLAGGDVAEHRDGVGQRGGQRAGDQPRQRQREGEGDGA